VRWFGLAAAFVAGCGLAGSASASYLYDVNVTGHVLGELPSCTPNVLNTCVDPNVQVGDIIRLTARFTSAYVIPGDPFNNTAGLYPLPASGPSFWRADIDGLTWTTKDNIDDGHDIIYYPPDAPAGPGILSSPSISFADGHVTGLQSAQLSSFGPPAVQLPTLQLSGFCVQYPCTPSPTTFGLTAGFGSYGDFYNSQGFYGTWDFADSIVTVTAVPEPTVWAMMIAGFGAIGVGLRTRRRRLRWLPLEAVAAL
jgi:hypothetical protein